jgi:hypothetical protein
MPSSNVVVSVRTPNTFFQCSRLRWGTTGPRRRGGAYGPALREMHGLRGEDKKVCMVLHSVNLRSQMGEKVRMVLQWREEERMVLHSVNVRSQIGRRVRMVPHWQNARGLEPSRLAVNYIGRMHEGWSPHALQLTTLEECKRAGALTPCSQLHWKNARGLEPSRLAVNYIGRMQEGWSPHALQSTTLEECKRAGALTPCSQLHSKNEGGREGRSEAQWSFLFLRRQEMLIE